MIKLKHRFVLARVCSSGLIYLLNERVSLKYEPEWGLLEVAHKFDSEEYIYRMLEKGYYDDGTTVFDDLATYIIQPIINLEVSNPLEGPLDYL